MTRLTDLLKMCGCFRTRNPGNDGSGGGEEDGVENRDVWTMRTEEEVVEEGDRVAASFCRVELCSSKLGIMQNS